MAAALFGARMADLGTGADVSSAGLLFDDRPATGNAVSVMSRRGLDLSAHRSRRLSPELLEKMDLVVAMAREHAREAVALAPVVWGRVFTLKEIVRRGEAQGPRGAGQPLADWLTTLAAGRRPADLLGASPDDDVEDPIGRPRREYEATAAELDQLTGRLAALLAGGP